MRRFIYVFITAMIITVGMIAPGALAENHVHGVCGETGCAGEEHAACADVTWTPWDGATDLTLIEGENNYYLASDVEIDTYINVASNQTLNLCLNGHTLTMTGSGCAVRTQWRFTLCDCMEGGTGAITHAAGVSGCGVETYGGSFYMYGGSITGNTAYRGAGVYVGAKTGNATDRFYMYGGSISGNSAPKKIGNVTNNQGGYGGGVYLDTGSMTMYGGSVSGNTSEMYGGGIAQSVNATLSVKSGNITENTSAYGGGINVAVNKKVTLENAVITGNSATYEGGSVFSAYSSTPATITMKNCTLTGNTAGKYGGAVSCCRLVLEDCTIQGNRATTSGGGVYATESLSIGGNMHVTGNTLDSGAASNLYLYGKRIECTAPLTGGEGSVGIYASPDEGTPVAVMTGATEADLSALTCDRTTAYAGIYNDIVYFSTSPIGDHSHDGVEYAWWPTGIPVLNEGDNYYFINDYMSMSKSVTIAEGQTLYLCLNGHTIDYVGDTALFNVEGGKLVICSCADGGEVKGYQYLIENGADGITVLKDVSIGGHSVSEDWLVSNKGMFDAENTAIGPFRYALNSVFVNEGTAVISGGSIGAQAYSTNTTCPVIDNAGTLTLAGGVNVYADANLTAVSNREGADCVLEKATVTGAAKGIVNNGSLEIQADAANTLTGNTVAIENKGTAVINGGAVTDNVTGISVSDGSFTLSGSASVHGNTGEGASDIAVVGGSFLLKDISALIGVPAMKADLEEGCVIEVSGALKRSLQVSHALLVQDKPRTDLLRRIDGEVTEADIAKLSLTEPGDYVVRINPNNTACAEAYIPTRVYAVTYDLAGGTLPEGSSNPADYTSEDATFTIANPVKGCYAFGGWTTADITDPMPKVTIYSGSEGAIALTANWVFAGHELAMDTGFVETDIGKQIILTASRSCAHTDSVDITWSVSDEDMLHPDGVSAGNDGSEARFTALMPGCATVIARTAEGSCAICDVIVHIYARMVLPDDLLSIRDAAFEGIPAVEIVLPEGITSIGSRAFADCENLLIINIPASVTEISDDAFAGCANLTIVCEKDSTAEKFAQDKGIACVCRG